MRRIVAIAIASMLGTLVVPLAPAPPAGAVTVGACTWDALEEYSPPLPPPTWGVVTPQPTAIDIRLRLVCIGVGTSTWEFSGGGTGSASCAAEAMSTTLVDGQGGYAVATWVRAGFYGWMFMQIQTPGGPSMQYAYEGPLSWVPSGSACLTEPAYLGSMIGFGPHMGV